MTNPAVEKMAEIINKACFRIPIKKCRFANNEKPEVRDCEMCHAQALWDKGYLKPPELTLISDEEIDKAFVSAFDKPINFNHKPTPSELIAIRLRAVAQAQHDHTKKELKGE